MKYHLDKCYFASQATFIRKSGDKVWEVICDNITENNFALTDVAKVLVAEFGWAPTTALQYSRAIITNVRIESGDAVIRRIGTRYAWA